MSFIYKQIRDNHPGIYNSLDPKFNKTLEREYKKATILMGNPELDQTQKRDIVNSFVKSFNDSHLRVSWHDNKPNQDTRTIVDTSKTFKVSTINNKVAWVNLPTFSLEKNQLENFQLILHDLSKIRHKDIIVFDIRGNQGGNSAYGSQIINTIFGKEYANARRIKERSDVFVDWRVSKKNIEHMMSLYDKYNSKWMQDIALAMEKRLSVGKHYYREKPYKNNKKKSNKTMANLTKAKIIVIIDEFNVSAALDFIDELKMMTTDVYLIGHTTNADRLYMEVRTIDLRSGTGNLSFPIKVYRNRARGDNVPYRADINYRAPLIRGVFQPLERSPPYFYPFKQQSCSF